MTIVEIKNHNGTPILVERESIALSGNALISSEEGFDLFGTRAGDGYERLYAKIKTGEGFSKIIPFVLANFNISL